MPFKIIPSLKLFKQCIDKARGILDLPDQIRQINNEFKDLKDIYLFHSTKVIQSNHPNPLNRFGMKCFSQTDEDGITLEILRRINQISSGVYAEFGVGDGTENNTLLLAALGWKGFWVGGEELKFDLSERERKRLNCLKEWVTLDNIVDLTKKGLGEIDAKQIDVISIDLDGNDIYFAETLLEHNFRAKLFIVEYNAKFPPPLEIQMPYDREHRWANDDCFGASLSSFNNLFNRFGYQLICCNSHSGANAFFIDAAFSRFFSDVPTSINEIYVEPRYHLYNKYGHNKSVKTIKNILGAR